MSEDNNLINVQIIRTLETVLSICKEYGLELMSGEIIFNELCFVRTMDSHKLRIIVFTCQPL